ncbi:MAG: glycosyltransferase [Betaproteobacteria bacterium]
MFELALSMLARNKLSVFLFHKVPREFDPLVPELTLNAFEQLVDFIVERFQVMPLEDAVARLQSGRLPPRTACITFDDGYPEWRDGVVPLLESRNAHATFFITSGQFNGLPMWHERVYHALRHAPGEVLDLPGLGLPPLPIARIEDRRMAAEFAVRHLKYQPLAVREGLLQRLEQASGVRRDDVLRMTADDLRHLHNRGFGIGAHTVSHPILTLCDPMTAAREIGGVREELEGIAGGSIRSFAYPNGRPGTDFSEEHIGLVRQAGYTFAVSTQWGAANDATPIFQIPRFTPWGPRAQDMAQQLVRNLVLRPRAVRTGRYGAGGKGKQAQQRHKVMVVENGAGFGGAIVALRTLLRHTPPGAADFHVVTNMPVGDFKEFSAVRSHRVVGDRIHDFRGPARAISQTGMGIFGTLLLFLLGRLDDLINRVPYLLRLVLLALKVRPNIIHGNNEPNSNREAMLVAKLLHIPYVQHLRGPLGASRHTPWLLSGPDMFIPVSRWLAGEIVVAGVIPERIRHIYDGATFGASGDGSRSGGLRAELGLPENTRLVAMIGMLVPWKGQQLFIDAIPDVHCAEPVAYLVVGGTPERGDLGFAASLVEQVAEFGLQGKVIFTGKRDDLPRILSEIDVVVSASTEPEPLGLVMLEAMVSGCVFVGPAFGAATEVVIDGENGFLFEPRSAESLSRKLEAALAVPAHSALSDRARREVAEQFGGERCAMATLNVYRGLAAVRS